MAELESERREVFANREDAIPVISFDGAGGEQRAATPTFAGREGGSQSARDRLRTLNAQATAKLKEKLDSLQESRRPEPSSMQERMLNLLLQQVIPSEEDDVGEIVDKPSRKHVDRPGFSLPTMSTNFRRFNARIGVVFVFQNQLIQLFNWRKPTHTMSFLAIYTFTCLDPSVMIILPLALTLYFVMVPSFLARHPPPPSLPLTNLYPLTGPPLAPPTRIKPAPELSKDFFRNMRDLQNCMEDFSVLHDAVIANVAPLTNFSSEPISSTLFIALFVSCIILFLTAHLLPWRAVALVSGWGAILAGHPAIQALLDTPENQSLLSSEVKTNQSRFNTFAESDISLDPAPEQREVEIFELQYRPLHADPGDEWEPMMFTPAPYTPLSPARIAGDRPKGTRFFEDVQSPRGWSYVDKKWSLDLLAKEWIEERCITGVEAELEGARWVIDVIKDEDEEGEGGMESSKSGEWRYGEWRRRRWVRVVERVQVERKDGES